MLHNTQRDLISSLFLLLHKKSIWKFWICRVYIYILHLLLKSCNLSRVHWVPYICYKTTDKWPNKIRGNYNTLNLYKVHPLIPCMYKTNTLAILLFAFFFWCCILTESEEISKIKDLKNIKITRNCKWNYVKENKNTKQ